jgi:hypothetical protein
MKELIVHSYRDRSDWTIAFSVIGKEAGSELRVMWCISDKEEGGKGIPV